MRTALSIAGSDGSGGAGIQADLKTFTAAGVYGMTAITAVTVQNTRGVHGVEVLSPELVGAQIMAVFEDIPPDAVKIGMVSNDAQASVIAECLLHYGAAHRNIVIDPVMRASDGTALSEGMERLFPLARLLTPNIPEAQALLGRTLTTEAALEAAARDLETKYECAVLLKGGHRTESADDLFCENGRMVRLAGERRVTRSTHGTGCTLSSAIAAGLAKGFSLLDAVRAAKGYITKAIETAPGLGHGAGPLNHMVRFDSENEVGTDW